MDADQQFNFIRVANDLSDARDTIQHLRDKHGSSLTRTEEELITAMENLTNSIELVATHIFKESNPSCQT